MAFAGDLRPGHGSTDAADRSYCARGVVCISAADAAGLGGINEGRLLWYHVTGGAARGDDPRRLGRLVDA
jgi:hypothetical protein